MISAASKEKVFDIILADALRECMESELKDVDNLAKGDPHKFPLDFERKMIRLKNSIGRKDRIKKCTNMCLKIAMTASAVFGIIFGGLLTQPEVYAAVQNVIRSTFDKFDKYEYIGEELSIEDFDNSFSLGYIPNGYSFTEGYITPISVILIYSNEDDEINFKYRIANDTVSNYDNEHNFFSEYIIDDMTFYYYENSDGSSYNTLLWYDDGYSFSILAHLSKDELVKIAENLKK